MKMRLPELFDMRAAPRAATALRMLALSSAHPSITRSHTLGTGSKNNGSKLSSM